MVWEIISNISSICGILGLPLALWQIYSIKSKIESTERGIKSILDIKEHEELNTTKGKRSARRGNVSYGGM